MSGLCLHQVDTIPSQAVEPKPLAPPNTNFIVLTFILCIYIFKRRILNGNVVSIFCIPLGTNSPFLTRVFRELGVVSTKDSCHHPWFSVFEVDIIPLPSNYECMIEVKAYAA